MTSGDGAVVDIQVACDDSDIPAQQHIESWVQRALSASARKIASGTELLVRVVDTEEIQSLNREYRHKDKVTNVLSFPTGAIAGLPPDAAQALGDIVVCAAVVSEEAAVQGKAVEDHWAHMLVHGALHLLGYDHESDAQAIEMEGLETRILKEYGLADPYGESHQRTDRI